MAAQPKTRLTRDQLEIVMLQRQVDFLACADDLDFLYLTLYGDGYPHMARDEFTAQGPMSRGVAVYHGERLVAFSALTHEERDHRIELGRLLRHPAYSFDMIVVLEPLARWLVDLTSKRDLLMYATTRLWMTSCYMELLDFELAGSLVYPTWSTSPWGGNDPAYPFLGIYSSCSDSRARRTAALPDWVRDTFPPWRPIFARHAYAPKTHTEPMAPDITEFPPKPGTVAGSAGEAVWVPCVDDDRLARRVEGMARQGFVPMAFLPGWKKVEGRAGIAFVSYLILERRGEAYDSYPTRFTLSRDHLEFNLAYHQTLDGRHTFYGRPMAQLFRSRRLPPSRRLLILTYLRFYLARSRRIFRKKRFGEQAIQAFPLAKSA